jgi:uncharacterized protein YceH (UPF0502 family)
MNLLLTDIEARVLGSLIEKEITTPDYYPLTLNSTVNACNQKSSRFPVMSLDEAAVSKALVSLREKKLVWEVHGAGSRTAKFKHNITSSFSCSPQETACLCVLLLRGPRTPGEIRVNSLMLFQFNELTEVDDTLQGLMTRGDGPFVAKLPRQHGFKEQRYAHLFCGEVDASAPVESDESGPDDAYAQLEKRVSDLENEVRELKLHIGKL